MNEVCRGPDCEEILYSWMPGEYCSSMCRAAARAAKVAEFAEQVLDVELAPWQRQVLERQYGVGRDSAGAVRVADLAQVYREVPPTIAGPVKLTRGQLVAIRSRSVAPTPWLPGSQLPPAIAGLPVELVDTVEESTPYALGYRPPSPRGFSLDHLIVDEAASFEPAPPSQRGWLRRALDRLVR